MSAEPPAIAPDRAHLVRITDDTAVLRVGPSRTEIHLPLEDLPPEAPAGCWLILDLQLHPPLVLGIDPDLPRTLDDG